MLLKEDVDKISKMTDEEINSYLETEDYKRLPEDDKNIVLNIASSRIPFGDETKSFEDFAEEVFIQEKIFDEGLDLNEDNIRKFKEELHS